MFEDGEPLGPGRTIFSYVGSQHGFQLLVQSSSSTLSPSLSSFPTLTSIPMRTPISDIHQLDSTFFNDFLHSWVANHPGVRIEELSWMDVDVGTLGYIGNSPPHCIQSSVSDDTAIPRSENTQEYGSAPSSWYTIELDPPLHNSFYSDEPSSVCEVKPPWSQRWERVPNMESEIGWFTR